MGIEFMSDARRLEQAGSGAEEDSRPRGCVGSLSWIPSPRSSPASAS